MTVSSIAAIPGLQPFVQLGAFTSGIPIPGSLWDTVTWDAPAAVWEGGQGYIDPPWHDITCDVNAVEINAGRDRSIDRWQVGNATITLNNATGWADVLPPTDDPMAFEVRPGRQIRFGVATGSGTTTPSTPYTPGYLTPTVGTVTTPDPGPPPPQRTYVFKLRGPATTTVRNHTIASQNVAAPQRSWVLYRHQNSVNYYTVYPNGDGTGVTNTGVLVANITGGDELLALSVADNSAGRQKLTPWISPDNGQTWTTTGEIDARPAVTPFDSNSVIRIGAHSGGNTEMFDGRIYSVECRSGLDPRFGTVQWRFDADDYPGSGASYTDPRGRTWTLTSAAAITAKIPYTPEIYTPPEIRWMYRWFIDTVDPVYEPAQEIDTVTVACVDAKGQAGKVATAETAAEVGVGDTVNARINRVLDTILWPPGARDIVGSGVTLQGTTFGTQAVDVIDRAADSAGGAVYGDSIGRIAYREIDWQNWPFDAGMDATIGNGATFPIPERLVPRIGQARSTPVDLTGMSAVTITSKVRKTDLTTAGLLSTIAAVMGTGAASVSWRFYFSSLNGLGWGWSTTGSNFFDVSEILTAAQIAAAFDSDVDFHIGVQVNFAADTLQAITSVDGATWTPLGSPKSAAIVPPFNADTPLEIGAQHVGTYHIWDGRIYWVEMRTGLNPTAGTLLWRFDADDYPGFDVSSYTDPRGRELDRHRARRDHHRIDVRHLSVRVGSELRPDRHRHPGPRRPFRAATADLQRHPQPDPLRRRDVHPHRPREHQRRAHHRHRSTTAQGAVGRLHAQRCRRHHRRRHVDPCPRPVRHRRSDDPIPLPLPAASLQWPCRVRPGVPRRRCPAPDRPGRMGDPHRPRRRRPVQDPRPVAVRRMGQRTLG